MTDFVCASTDLEGGLALPGVVSCSVFACASTELVPQGSISGTSINAMADAVWAKILSVESFTSGMAGDFIKSRIDAAISSRATTAEVAVVEAKVDLIPTTPVLDNDARLDNLDAAITSRASQASVDAIPITPLLTGDSRLDNLDAPVSLVALEATLSTGVLDIRGDISAMPAAPSVEQITASLYPYFLDINGLLGENTIQVASYSGKDMTSFATTQYTDSSLATQRRLWTRQVSYNELKRVSTTTKVRSS